MIGVATGTDMLVWVAVMWAVFRVTDTIATLGDAAGRLVASAVRRRRARRQLANTIRKWEDLRRRLDGQGLGEVGR